MNERNFSRSTGNEAGDPDSQSAGQLATGGPLPGDASDDIESPEAEFADLTRAAAATSWQANLVWDAPSGLAESPIDVCAHFRLEAYGIGVRHLQSAEETVLVAGDPRPEQVPSADAGEADPALALITAVRTDGVAALRHTEGPWALALWNAGRRELLLAVDRLARRNLYFCRTPAGIHLASSPGALARSLDLGTDPAVLAAAAEHGSWPVGATPFLGVERLAPGSHLSFAADGKVHAGVHGGWRVEKRDRRPWPLILGEFEERLKSVLRVLGEGADLILLAEQPWVGALLAAELAQLPGPQARVLWIPGWSSGDAALWQDICRALKLQFIDGSAHAVDARVGTGTVTVAGVGAGVPPEAGAAAGSQHGAKSAGQLADDAVLDWHPGLRQLACQAHSLAPPRGPGGRPTLLLSGAGFDLALPPDASGWERVLRSWPWRIAAARQPGALGARLARSLTTRWQVRLEAALAGSALDPVWPMLDETVSHFLANLEPGLRDATLWQGGFRARVLASALPRALRERIRAAL